MLQVFVGRVRDIVCDPDQDWQLTGLIIDSIGSTLVPDSVVSTFSVDSKFIAQVNPNQVKHIAMDFFFYWNNVLYDAHKTVRALETR